MEEFIERDYENFQSLRWLDDYMIGHKGFIAGGCFKNIFNKEKVKDIDIFFENKLEFEMAKMYYEENEEYFLYYENQKVTAFKHKDKEIQVELIKSVFGKPIDIIKDFDFSITKFVYYKEYSSEDGEEHITYKIIHHKDYFEHLFFKRLVTGKELKYPNGTFERMVRYIKYGYMPCKETKMNIINAIKNNTNELDKVSQSLYDGVD